MGCSTAQGPPRASFASLLCVRKLAAQVIFILGFFWDYHIWCLFDYGGPLWAARVADCPGAARACVKLWGMALWVLQVAGLLPGGACMPVELHGTSWPIVEQWWTACTAQRTAHPHHVTCCTWSHT